MFILEQSEMILKNHPRYKNDHKRNKHHDVRTNIICTQTNEQTNKQKLKKTERERKKKRKNRERKKERKNKTMVK